MIVGIILGILGTLVVQAGIVGVFWAKIKAWIVKEKEKLGDHN